MLDRLGLLQPVRQQAAVINALVAQRLNGKPLVELRYDRLPHNQLNPVCQHGLGVHRGEFYQRLLDRAIAAGIELREGTRVTGLEQSADKITVQLDSGEASDFEILIATDGSNSRLRRLSGIPTRIVEYPYAAYWTTGRCSAVTDHLYQVVDGCRQLVGLLPIGEGRCSFFWGVKTADRDQLVRRGIGSWRESAIAFCPAASELVDGVDSFEQLTFATYRHASMRRNFDGRLVFLGDAGHASSPHLGQGVNLALEDAELFCQLLERETRNGKQCNVEAVAGEFWKQRKAKIRYYQMITHWLTPFFQSDASWRATARNLVLPWLPRLPIVGRMMHRSLAGIKQGWTR